MALDIDRSGSVAAVAARGSKARTPASVREVLEWAFSVERVSLDFDEFAPRASAGIEAVLIRQAMLGCRVDGGGWSPRATDAEIVAAVLSRLPRAQGGRRMAVIVAELARAGSVPDWMPGAVPKLVPVEWKKRAGRQGVPAARTEIAGYHLEEILVRNPRNRSAFIRRLRRHEIRFCPCRWAPSHDRIAAARRQYLDWWGALLHLQAALRTVGLERFEVTPDMPRLTPWLPNSGEC